MGRWDYNGPEEGDTIDLSVIIMFDGNEIIEIPDKTDAGVDERKEIARKLCEALNLIEAEPLI